MRGVVNCFMINNENNFKNDRNFYDGVDKFSEGDVENMPPIDDVVEIILDQHTKQLNNHDEKICDLQKVTNEILIQQGQTNIRLSNIENGQLKLERYILENNNNQQNFQKELIDNQKELVNKIIEKDESIQTSKIESKGKIRTQTIITVGAILTSLIAGAVSIYTVMHQVVK